MTTSWIDLRLELDRVNRQMKIALDKGEDKYLNEVGRHFHLGMVGGSGRNTRKLNKRRERALDRSLDAARTVTELHNRQQALERQLASLEEGRADAREAARLAVLELVKALKPGDPVMDSAYGECTVVRVNQKTLTIRSAAGTQEPRPFSLLAPKTLPEGYKMPKLPSHSPYKVGAQALFYFEGNGSRIGTITAVQPVEGKFRDSWLYTIESDEETLDVPHLHIRYAE